MTEDPKVEVQEIATASESEGTTSVAFGISIRAWLSLFLVWTICAMSVLRIEVTEPLYSMGLLALGFYFGQKGPKP